MTFYSFKKSALTLAMIAASGAVLAQTNAGADAQRSIQESQSKLPPKPSAKPMAPELQDFSGASPMDRLDLLDIKDDELRTEIEAYWKGFLGKAVSEEQMIAFKNWVNNTAKTKGFMAYAQTDVVGNKLQIRLVIPRIKTIKVFTRDEALANRYLKDLNPRFEADFKSGMPLDILSLEQKLDEVSFSLPLELDVVIRSAGPDMLDLLVNVTEAPSRPWEMLGGLMQTNNYGLRQFGRAQVLGQVSFGGHLPSARLTLTGQKSEGITYLRSEYDMPVASLDSRFRIGLGHSSSEGIRGGQSVTQSQSTDLVMGLEKILGHRREMVFKGGADVSTRQSRSQLALDGSELNRLRDHQLRLRLSADSDRLSNEPMRAEVTAVVGDYTSLANFSNVPQQAYTKIEFNARKQFNLSEDGKWYGLAKVRGQRTSQHMDGTNQISLGGANGVRAYSSADGLGDDGLLTSLEFNYKLQPNQTWGVFYDGGVVRASKTPQQGIFSETYALQALGLQTSGNVSKWFYNVTVAKGIGGNKGALATNIESKPNNWRMNASLTYVF